MPFYSVFESILNFFSRPFTSGNGRGNRFIVFVIAVVAIIICCCATLFSVPKKFVFMADSMTFNDVNSVTIGENSDIHFCGVPHDYITVTPSAGGGATWHVARQHRDTLQYFKINNSNPNAHEVRNDESQRILINIPIATSKGDSTIAFSISGAEVWKEWKDFRRQSDVMARHFVTHNILGKGGATHKDSTVFLRQVIDNLHIRSFFHSEHGRFGGISAIKLVILDTATTIDGEGYAYQGTVDGSDCKVQFYNVTNYCYADGSGANYFQIDDVNYVMKPLVRLTEWGAGHIMLHFNLKGGAEVCFPKGIGYVGTVDSLRTYAGNSSNVITFRQSSQSYPSNSDIFLPYFSHNANQDLFNLEFSKDGSNLTVHDNYNKATVVGNPSSFPQLIPALTKVDLASGRTVIHTRIGFIDKPFMLRYLYLAFLVFLVLLAITCGPWSPLRNDECRGLYAQNEINSLPSHVAVLLFLGFVFCVCKSMIAMKLSYSFPYFEKLTVITPFNCAMGLLVFFTLMLILNSRVTTYRHRSHRNRHRRIPNAISRWAVWGVLVAVAAGLCYTLFQISDRQIASDVIASYLPYEIRFTANWLSSSAYGTLDNHRTVSYALIVVEAALLGILAVLYIVGTAWEERLSTQVSGILSNIIPAAVRSKFNDVWDAIISGEPMPLLARFTVKNPRKGKGSKFLITFWNDAVSHIPAVLVLVFLALLAAFFHVGTLLVAALLAVAFFVCIFDFVHDAFLAALRDLFPHHFLVLIALFLIGNISGNFGTAFITLLVILGLPNALSRVKFTDPSRMEAASLPRHVVFCEMLLISVFYMIAAMVADNGYLTNYLGFIMAILCFYFIRLRPGHRGRTMSQTDRHESRWVRAILVFVALLVFFLPSICGHLADPEEVNYSRMTRRVMLFSNIGELQKVGYRYAESDSEFMVVMSHYMQMKKGGDPLSNDTHFLHASVSTGQSPVVLNDLSVPVAFFGSYGLWSTTIVYFLLIFALLMLVFHFSFSNIPHKPRVYLTRPMQWRLLAVMMWVGTSFYIYFSYLGVLPFTGRLNPGYGVDAVGEALETAVLLAFMAAVSPIDPKSNDDTPGALENPNAE